MSSNMPVWLRSLLVVLNFFSFLPQILQLHKLKSRANINVLLVLSNIFSATAQLNLSFFFSNDAWKRWKKGGYSSSVRQISVDWTHLAQATGIWLLLSSIILVTAICYASMPRKKKVQIIFLFLLATYCALLPLVRGHGGRGVELELMSLLHALINVNPAVTGAIYMFYKEEDLIRPHSTSLLNVIGFASQIAVHIIMAMSWLMLTWPLYKQFFSLSWTGSNGILSWYYGLGWVFVEHALFAVFQGRLLWVLLKERKAMARQCKEKPLLGEY